MITDDEGARSNPTMTNRSIETYKQAVRKNFSFLKCTERLDDLYAKSIPLSKNGGFLVPVCKLNAGDVSIITKLAQWRADNAESFPTQFPVTLASTKSWLRLGVVRIYLPDLDRIILKPLSLNT